VEVDHPCPFFSWQEVDGALGYELVVYRLHEAADKAPPVLRRRFEGALDGWAPPADLCLEPGHRYAWSVRAVALDGVSDWSAPRLFRVAESPPDLNLLEAIEVVRSYLQAQREPPTSPLGDGQVESVARLASELEAPIRSSPPRAAATVSLTIDGGLEAISFTGDGSNLTGLEPGSIAGGTAEFSVLGSSYDVNCTGCIRSTHIGSGQILASDIRQGQVNGSDIDPSTVQSRISGACSDDQVIESVGSDGTVTCATNTQVILGQEHAVSNFNGGVSSVSVSIANRICFLAYVRFRDTDGNDNASCKIERVSGSWVLFAASQGNADAACRMRCIEISSDL
jgi:hypothetical protein